MNCVFRITDPILKNIIGEKFNSIEELRQAFDSLVDKHSIIPVNIQSVQESFSRRKFAKVYRDEISNEVKVQIVMPGQEKFSEIYLGRAVPQDLKEPGVYGTYDSKVLTFPSTDNFIAFYLANYLFVDSVDSLPKLITNIENTLKNTLGRMSNKPPTHSFEIEDLGFVQSLVEYAKLLYTSQGKEIPQLVYDFYDQVSDRIDKYHGEEREHQKVESENKKNLQKKTEPQPSVIFFSTGDVVEGKRNTKPLVEPRRQLLQRIEDPSQFQIRLSKGSPEYAQEADLTTEMASSGVVGILQFEGKPVYLTKEGLTTNPEEAIHFKYKIDGEEKSSPQLYLLLNNSQFGKLKQDFLKSDNPDSFVFQVSNVKTEEVYSGKQSFEDSGFSIKNVLINDLKDVPWAGIAYTIKDGTKFIVNPTPLNEQEIDEVIDLLKYQGEDVEKIVTYLNDLLSMSDEKVKEGKTGREIIFYPAVDRIMVRPERIKEGEEYMMSPDQTPIYYEENPELVRKALRAARIRFKKEKGSDKLKFSWDKYSIKDGNLIQTKVSPTEGEKFYTDHIQDINTQTTDSVQLVTFSEPVFQKQEFRVGLMQVNKGESYTIGQINQLLMLPVSKGYERDIWNTLYNLYSQLGKPPRFVFRDYEFSTPGFYNQEDNTIYLSYSKLINRKDQIPRILVEEVLHAVTIPRLQQYEGTKEYQDLEQDYERAKELRKTYKETEQYQKLSKPQQEEMDKIVDYHLDSFTEFVVGISQPYFRAFLRLGESRGLLDEIIDKVKKILNLILKDLAPSLYTDVTTDLFNFISKKPTEVPDVNLIQPEKVDIDTQEPLEPLKKERPKRQKREEKDITKFFAAPLPLEDSIDLSTVRGLDAELGQYLMNNGYFGQFVQGKIRAEELWNRYYNQLVDEYDDADDERKGWIDYFFDNEDKLKKAWREQSKLFSFNDDKLFLTEDETDPELEDEKPEEMEGKDPGYNKVDSEQSKTRLELADRFARMFVKLTPGERIKGLTQLADFTVLWNKLQRELEGTISIDEQIEILSQEDTQNRIKGADIIVERLTQLQNTPIDNLILNSFQNSFSTKKVGVWIPFFTEVRKNGRIDHYTVSFYEQVGLDVQNIELEVNANFRNFVKDNGLEIKVKEGDIEYPSVDNLKLIKLLQGKDVYQTYRKLFPLPENVNKDEFITESGLLGFNKRLISLLKERAGNSYIVNGDFVQYLRQNKSWETPWNTLGQSKGMSTQVNRLMSEISKYHPLTVSNMTRNAEGQNQSIFLSWSSWHLNNKELNEGKSFRSKNPIFKYSLLKPNEVNKIEPVNLNGSTYHDGSRYAGKVSMDLDYTTYLRQEIYTFLTRGLIEINRVETKNSTFGYQFDWGDIHPIPFKLFNTDSWQQEAVNIFLTNNQEENAKGYLRGELERIQKEINNPVTYYSKYEKIKTDFHLFTYLPDSVKQDKTLPFDEFYQKHKETLKKSLLDDIKSEVEEFKKHVQDQTGEQLTINHPILNTPEVQAKIKELGLDKFLTFLVVNRRIYQIEHVITGHGDIGQQDKYYKRSGSNISTGTPISLNQKTLTTLNNTLNRTFTGRVPTGKSFTISDDIYSKDDPKFNKGVKQSLTLSYKAFGIDKSETEINQDAQKKTEPYKKINVADGQAFMTPDFGRMLMMATNNWTTDREEGFWYQVIINKKNQGKQLTQEEREHLNNVDEKIKAKGGIYWFFPPLKMQYRGPFYPKVETNVQLEGLDKFSLTWLWPDELEGKKFGLIYNKMVELGLDYGKFESGTKIATPIPDNIIQQIQEGKLELSIDSEHGIDLKYMKEQVKAAEKFKNKSSMSTQARKLILSNIRVDTPEGRDYLNESIKEGVKLWKQSQEELSKENKRKLIEELSTDGIIDNKKLADKIKEEADKRELPESMKAIFEYYGEEFYTRFEQALSPQLVDTLIYSLLKNNIVKPKFPGEQYIQIASSIYDPIEGRDLKFYEYTNEGVTEAECKISLSGEFLKLLHAPEVNNNLPPEFEQLTEFEKIEYKRFVLNQLLLIPEFVEKYKDSLTVYSSRIPGQGYNSMDIFRIKEFLPIYSGAAIVLPPEATKKSGTDFDFDKLPTITPELTKTGKAKDSHTNNIIRGAKLILLDPINFHRLVTPNSTDEFDPVIQTTLDKLGVSVEEPRFDSIFRWTTHLNKWLAMKMKNPLGIGATNNTFYTLQQDADVTINDEFFIGKNSFSTRVPFNTEDKPFYFPLVNNIDKLEYVNQFINITVDVASNDAIGYTGLKQENTALLLFLIERGVPFPDAFYFINQPIIFKYHQLLDYYSGQGYSSREAKNLTISRLLGVSTTINKFGNELSRSKGEIYEDIAKLYEGKTFTNLQNAITPLDQIKISPLQKSILAFYLVGQEMAEAQRQAQSYNNFDTSPSSNYFYSELRERMISGIRESGMFNTESIERIHTDSVISPLNAHKEFTQLSQSAFPIKRNPYYVNLALNLGKQVYNSFDQDKFFRKFDNDYLLAILQNYGTINRDRIKDNLENLMDRWEEVKNNPQVKDLMITKYITPNYSKSGLVSPSMFFGLDGDATTLDQMAKDLRLMYKNPETKQWTKDFIETALFTTLFSQSPVYYLKALPHELVTPYLQEAFDNYITNPDFIQEFANAFLYQRGMEFSQYFLDFYKAQLGRSLSSQDKRSLFNQEAWRYTDYEIDVEEIEQKSKLKPVTVNTYEGLIKSLNENEIFVFGSNPIGINGNPSKGTGGAALVAHNIAGVKQGEKMDNKLSESGKAWGITTVSAPGKKRSKSPEQIKQGVKKLYDYATNNPNKRFLVAYQGTEGRNLNGYTNQELADMFSAFSIPNNIVFEKEFSTLLRQEVLPLDKPLEMIIQMQPNNVQKIIEGIKTSTVRSKDQADKIGIPVGESRVVNFGGKPFTVTNRGLLNIEEAGGKEAILKSEGVSKVEDFKYQQTKEWFNGKGKLYVYSISLDVTQDITKPEFNKLPSKSSTKTFYYAGVGSRETPTEVLKQMTELAKELESKGYTLRSGGAEGADTAFEKGSTKKEIFYAKDATDLTRKIAKEIHPKPSALGTKALDLMARNTNQVFGKDLDSPVDFVIAWTKDGLTNFKERTINSGGTGQAIDMASRKGIPVINMKNPNWRQELDSVLTGENTPVQPKQLEFTKGKKGTGEEISSYKDSLAYALTNPVFTSPTGQVWSRTWTDKQRKWRDYMKEGIVFENKTYKDVEEAYQKNKSKYPIGEARDNFMLNLIEIKLRTYPKLVEMINKKGGIDYLTDSTHQPTKQNSHWETGGDNMFIKLLTQAYLNVTGIQVSQPKQFKQLELFEEDWTKPCDDIPF